MYDRLLKLLAEQDEAQRQKTIFDVINTKKAVKKLAKKPVPTSEPPRSTENRRKRFSINPDRDEHQGRGSMG